MRRFRAMTAGMMLATAALGACDQYEIRKKDSPDPAPAAAPVPAQSEQDKAIIAATPQVSLSEKDRREIEGVARNYLDEAAKELAKGFSPMPGVQDIVVALQPTQVHAWTVGLKRGETYRFIAECDSECSDMDMELLDPAGKIVERDTLPDSAPVINIRPAANGTYTARLIMKTCTVAPCYAAARLYHQTGPIPDDDAPPATEA
ncbi:MAG: hypothetical protein P0Y50_03835 [Candidatus Brevundimonas colombiensis]|uniref:Lipoprotein n=1 Tax=Candidatus Brevundimonas colombiensis TaxID=3121376 RepID=A0AAJ5X464_9CAUL|nr:hypothetical protein [Brevundimonas sp.]WEK40753.1 MAG: hypothetical protein P0Y50_03835 [Brevundimonas sp.]